MTIKAKKSKINLREKLAELLNFRQIRDRLDGLGLYLGKDRTDSAENVAVRGGASIDDLQLAEISAALGDTAVDVFVYDTRNDSDGGKWRERTSHTSWYNEELNTATRGGRREFPAVAVIVAEANKVTIYDGDDPDLSMWMVFEDNSTTGFIGWGSTVICVNEAVSALNAQLVYGGANGLGGGIINFAKDDMRCVYDNPWTVALRTIVDRNETTTIISGGDGVVIVNNKIHDVAMTVLPNAPIDDDTGLPIPTIAVATDGGVSVIRDDGSVVDLTAGASVAEKITINSTHIYFQLKEGSSYYTGGMKIPNQNTVLTGNLGPEDFRFSNKNWSSAYSYAYTGTNDILFIDRQKVMNIGVDQFLVKSTSDHFTGYPNLGSQCYISSTYNTGWMPGDIKLATLSDTKIETVGVDETSNLITNSTFVDTNSDGADDWTLANGASTSTSSGVVTITNTATNYGYIYQIISTEIGKRYQFSVDVDYTADGGRILLGKDGAGTSADVYLNQGDVSSDQTIQYYFTAETESLYVRIGLTGNTIGDSISYSNISVTETGELITNGTFDNETEGWALGAGWTIGTGVASCDGTNYATLTQDNVLSGGVKYVLTFDVSSYTSGNVEARWYDSDWTTIGSAVSAVGTHAFTFTPGQNTNGSLTFRSGSFVGSIDNVSVRLAESDRSVNDNGLQVFGEIDKSPVATGADLVAYSGFSADDYLMQPYNSDLDFGTGDFSIMFWLKFSENSVYDAIISKENSWVIDTGQDNSISFKFWNGSTYGGGVSADGDSVYGAWRCLCVKRESGVLSLFLDGVEKTDPNNPYSNSADFTSEFGLIVGSDPDDIAPAEKTSVSLLRISKTAPTDEQIAKIYHDEKVLFQDGAQATLYGTSDAVTALAYDDKTELLHVGTSSGRSDFSGLRRINNTTTAVTTSISASNNLIAEQ